MFATYNHICLISSSTHYFNTEWFFSCFMVFGVVFMFMFTQRSFSFGTTQFGLGTFRRRNLFLVAMRIRIWYFCCISWSANYRNIAVTIICNIYLCSFWCNCNSIRTFILTFFYAILQFVASIGINQRILNQKRKNWSKYQN